MHKIKKRVMDGETVVWWNEDREMQVRKGILSNSNRFVVIINGKCVFSSKRWENVAKEIKYEISFHGLEEDKKK